MTKNPETKKTMRKPYNKPRLEQVKLIAEEAVLVNCKTHPGGGLGNPCGPTAQPLSIFGI